MTANSVDLTSLVIFLVFAIWYIRRAYRNAAEAERQTEHRPNTPGDGRDPEAMALCAAIGHSVGASCE